MQAHDARAQRSHPYSLGLLAAAVSTVFTMASPLAAQDNPDLLVDRVEVRPDSVVIQVGQRAHVEILALDAAGNVVEGADLLGSAGGAEIGYDPVTSEVVGLVPGTTTVGGRIRRPVPEGPGFQTIRGRGTVTVLPLPVSSIELSHAPERMFEGTHSRLRASAHSAERERQDVRVGWTSVNPNVVSISPGGAAYAVSMGRATLRATASAISREIEIEVVENPITSLLVAPREAAARVGDVLRLEVVALDGQGSAVEGIDPAWTWSGLGSQPYDALLLESDRPSEAIIVPNEAGPYSVTASVGSLRASIEFEVVDRPHRRQVRRVAHSMPPTGQVTTDLWVFEGTDGRDYTYTGTFSGGLLYAWDVTDPSQPVITDSLTIDGRRVNDVKINHDATLAVVTSENAPTRRNGITLVDITEPAHPRKITHFTENLTGGIHNAWIEGDLVYAVNYGTRDIHIVDVSNPEEPKNVGRWGLPKEDKFIHDVNVLDGLAYLSYWDDGVVILDVGAGIKGGTPTDPEFVSSYQYSYKLGDQSYGNTHHAIRYGNYVFTGDEIFGCSECVNGARGYIHVVDVSDISNPREVAFYKVPEAGAHNMWAENGKLYIGHYQAGLRIVDISGELRGDLYRQGREIGWFMTEDATGPSPFATSTWGAQPYKGKIFASDGSSGLWVVEMDPDEPLVP